MNAYRPLNAHPALWLALGIALAALALSRIGVFS